MRSILTVVFFVCCSVNLFGQTSNWVWAKAAVTPPAGLSEGYSVCTDTAGNVYETGGFASTTIAFGSSTLVNASSSGAPEDIFLVKYDAGGNAIWAIGAGGTDNDYGFNVCTDPAGNVILCGEFRSPSITFGSITLTNNGNEDLFIAKFDTNGNVLWARSAGGANYDDAYSVSADVSGTVFLTGSFQSSTITFGPVTLVNSGTSNVFVVKYDPNGNVVWAQRAGGTIGEKAYSVSTDSGGNVLVAGMFGSPTISFGSITLTNNSSPGLGDVFIVKYDPGGNVLWAKSAGGTNDDQAYGIKTGANGNFFITGYFSSSSLAFDSFTLNNANTGTLDLFVVRYDANGNVIWAKRAGGALDDIAYSLSTDTSENVFVTGSFTSSSITFASVTLTPPSGSVDPMFILKYDSAGTLLCASALSSGGDDANAVATDPFGNAFVGGDFMSNPFILGMDSLTLTGQENIFVAKYVCLCAPSITFSGDQEICKGDTTTLIASGAASYVWLPGMTTGNSITVSPLTTTTYSVIGTSPMGCSDTITVTVHVNQPPLVSLNLSAIDTQCVTVNSVLLYGGFPLGGLFNGAAISGNNFSPSAAGPGTFSITYYYTDSTGCIGYASGTIFVSACTGIAPVEDPANEISISPNPSNGIITLNSRITKGEIFVFNVLGEIVFESKIISSTATIDLSNQANGIYFVNVKTEEGTFLEKIIIR